jgi:alkylation response protein AidB-like acyl-CoA dehydrogenase
MRPQFRDVSAARDTVEFTPRANAERLLADVRALLPEITLRAAEIEAARRLPHDLVDTFREIGVFRMLVPHSHGGLELDLPSAVEVIATLARADGSVGWSAMIGGIASIFAPLLPRETYERVYLTGPDVVLAGSIQPAGIAEPVAGGWRVSGRWPFASGCEYADWMVGFCVMAEPDTRDSGGPVIRGVALPACDWQIEDTWHVAGLKGTGSHHIALKDRFVPGANIFDPAGAPCVPGPLYPAVPHVLPVVHNGINVGMAEGALGELVALAQTGRKQFKAAVPLRDSEVFQAELGRIAADLRAARTLMQAQAASHWRHALAETLRDDALLTQAGQTGAWISATCVRAADACFALAGASALYDSSPLQRRLRDLHAAALHATIHPRAFGDAGKRLLAS